MPKFKVWLAADTLLYMPAYALKDLGILERVATSAGFDDPSISVEAMSKGDRLCIDTMLRNAEDDPITIHVAMADPTRALQADPDGKRVSLLGALIKRPPLWEIGRSPTSDDAITRHRFIYYNESLATGNFLGRRAAATADDEDREPCKYGEEFGYLEDEAKPGVHRVITADVRRMLELMARDDSVVIHKRFAKDPELANFVTTGILSHQRYARDKKRELALFMEALRSACILLRTAETPTASLVEEIMLREKQGSGQDASKPALGTPQSSATAAAIAKEIFRNDIYADSLSVTHAEWTGALRPRPMEGPERRKASAYFYKIYNPHPSRDMTEDWLVRAITDYGRFAQEARRLRGTSFFSIASILLLAINVAFADQHMRSVGARDSLIHYMSIGAIIVSAGTLAAVLLALIRERPQILLRFQNRIAMDDALATPLLVSFATLVAFGLIYLPAKFIFHAPPDESTIWSTVIGTVGVIGASTLKMWHRRDA